MFKRSLDQLHLVGLGIALVLLITVALLSYAGWREYVQSADETRRIVALIQASRALALDVEHAEIIQQRFLLTADPSILSEYVRVRDQIRKTERTLDQSRNKSLHSGALDGFRDAIQQGMSALERPIRLHHETSVAVALAEIRSQEDLISRVIALQRAFEKSQSSELDVRRTRTRQYAMLSQLTATLGCTCIFVIVLLSSIRIQHLVALRARLTQDLARLADELRHLNDSVPQLVWRMNESGEVEYFNQRWMEFSQPSILNTKTWHELLHPNDRDEFLEDLSEGLKNRKGLTAECRLRNSSSGGFHWFLFRASPRQQPDSADLKWYGTFTDINELKRMELALQRANKDLEQFSYAAAHDLQEPLRNIENSLSILRHGCENQISKETERWISESIQNAERMRTMVKDLLTFSKAVGSGSMDQLLSNADEVVRDALANLNGVIQQNCAEIRVGQLPTVRIQPLHLLQIFQNLIGNSLKYHTQGVTPIITVSAERGQDEWIFAVQDNGIGFDPKYAERIFGMFKRLHGREEYTGTGIGLAICARIVAHYAGRIWAESQRGEGATFRFALPVHEEQSRLRRKEDSSEQEKEFDHRLHG